MVLLSYMCFGFIFPLVFGMAIYLSALSKTPQIPRKCKRKSPARSATFLNKTACNSIDWNVPNGGTYMCGVSNDCGDGGGD